MAALRKLWNEAERIYDDELPRNPFRKIDIVKQQPKGQRATDIPTIHKIFNYKGTSKRAVLARDGFILSCKRHFTSHFFRFAYAYECMPERK